MAKLVFSHRLDALWERIVEKDGEDAALDAFRTDADVTLEEGIDCLFSAIDAFSVLDGSLYYYIDGRVDDAENILLFCADDDSEVAVHNRILRTWCEQTGRTVKAKKK